MARPPSGIVAAVEPELAVRRHQRGELAAATGAACAPASRPGHAGLERRGRKLQADRAQRRDRDAGILELVAAVEFRRRQIEQPVAVLIDQPAALLGRGPVFARDLERRAQPRRLRARSPPAPSRGWRRHHGGHVTLEDAGLLGGDLLDRVAEKFDDGRATPA